MKGNHKHGGATGGRSPTYVSWEAMKQRCFNPNHPGYANYGGRGISICWRWLSFEAFIADMGPRPAGCTLERRKVNGNYTPANCRWATPTTQARNRRNQKLTTTKVAAIRASNQTNRWLAMKYKVDPALIRRIRKGEIWR